MKRANSGDIKHLVHIFNLKHTLISVCWLYSYAMGELGSNGSRISHGSKVQSTSTNIHTPPLLSHKPLIKPPEQLMRNVFLLFVSLCSSLTL